MTEFISLTCPSCGGKLQITSDIERFACANCGNEHLVKRSGGIISLQPVLQKLNEVQASAEKTASELAIPRIERELGRLHQQKRQIEMSASQSASPYLIIGSGVAIIALLITVFTSFQNGLANVFCVSIWLVEIIGFAVLVRRSEKLKNDERVKAIEIEIETKEKELKNHKQRIHPN